MRFATLAAVLLTAVPLLALEPIPDKLVVLTFDDAVKSHYTVVRRILKQHKFGATFFITEGFDFTTDKENYLTWDEIAQLHRDGFEIGNHTRDHMQVTKQNLPKLEEQIEAINRRCRQQGIPRPISFAYAGNSFDAARRRCNCRRATTVSKSNGDRSTNASRARSTSPIPGSKRSPFR